ncbi:MAG: DNA N-6-adenine-methyltransferase [Reyranella sp.]
MTTAPLFAGIGGHHSARSTTDEWLTPPAVIDALGGPDSFDLDPCSPVARPWPTARKHLTVFDNGLLRAWFGRVWLNPPYGRSIGAWLGRMATHDRGVALIFARTETEAFCRYVWGAASGLLFIAGRLDFLRVDGTPMPKRNGKGAANSGAPSVLVSYGARDLDMLAGCGLDGHLVPLRLPRSVIAAALAGTWRDEVLTWLRQQRGPVVLEDLYRAFAGHPKAAGNPNFRAKIRQVLQQGPFRRVARGQWECAA